MINTKGKKTDLRCNNCAKKLAEGEAVLLSIKCPRCGHVNEFSNAPRERGVCELLAHNPEH
ncbi:Com family DNA-binding transcriptional regulator [Methylophilus sp. DW102]|uniref:Com family DNA-binding transcriptional regulator n=1 Tax=Methylophilus sp. DW102 TaxID=3095607 RepID=UPI0030CF1CEC